MRLRELTEQNRLIDAGTRPAYLPVAYVEPFESSGNLIGVDLSTNKIYAQLMAEARKAGKQAASGPVSQALVDGAGLPSCWWLSRSTGSTGLRRRAGADRLPNRRQKVRKVMSWAFCN